MSDHPTSGVAVDFGAINLAARRIAELEAALEAERDRRETAEALLRRWMPGNRWCAPDIEAQTASFLASGSEGEA